MVKRAREKGVNVIVNNGINVKTNRETLKLAAEFEATIPLSLNSGDNVLVKATCRLGGSAEAELIIPTSDPDSYEK